LVAVEIIVDVTGTPLSSGRPLPRESDGSAVLRIVVQRPSSGCKTRRCHPSTRMLREQGRHVIYRHSGCREPAVIFRRPTRIWNSSSCRRNRCPVWHRPDECTRPARRVLIRAALEQSRVYTVDLQEHHMNEKAHTVRAARHYAGLVCIATCVQRALDSGREL